MTDKDSIGPFVTIIVLVLIFGAFVGIAAYSDLKSTQQEQQESIRHLKDRVELMCRGEGCR